jgi:sigma-E factor negative regulatory protein RseC
LVSAIDPDHPDQGEVTILSQSACAACHAKGVCTGHDSQAKVMKVRFLDVPLGIGDPVRVMIRESLGWQALILAMVIPLGLLMGTLLFSYQVLRFSDTTSALLGLVILVPYYLILSRFNKRFAKRFVMYAKKI